MINGEVRCCHQNHLQSGLLALAEDLVKAGAA